VANQQGFAIGISHAASPLDAFDTAESMLVSQSDSATATVTPDSGNAIPVSLSETGTATDVLDSAQQGALTSDLEVVTATDTVLPALLIKAALTELISASDLLNSSFGAAQTFNESLAESAGPADTVSAGKLWTGALLERQIAGALRGNVRPLTIYDEV